MENESSVGVPKIQFVVTPKLGHATTNLNANTPPLDADPNPADMSNRIPLSECIIDNTTVHSKGDVFVQTAFDSSPPSSAAAAATLSPKNHFVTQFSSLFAASDVDLGTAPAFSTFLSGSDGGDGRDDHSPRFISIPSTDSGIEKTLGISMKTPLPIATLRKLLSCSSDTAEEQNEDGVN